MAAGVHCCVNTSVVSVLDVVYRYVLYTAVQQYSVPGSTVPGTAKFTLGPQALLYKIPAVK